MFTHGATMDHGLFQHQIEYFAQQYKTIVWDVPKHGLSRPYEGFSLPKAASELIGILDAVYRVVKGYQQNRVLPVSLLVIYGDADHTGKVQKYCKQWAERENRPLQVITDAAHNSNMDNPRELNRILGEFFNKKSLSHHSS